MSRIIPPHACVANLEKLGIENIPSTNPKSINFTRFMRYIEVERYPEEVVDEIYKKILESPETGKEQLYKLVFDVLIFSGIARDLDLLVNLYRGLGCLDDELEEEINSMFGTYLYASQILKKRGRKTPNKYIRSIAYDSKNFRSMKK